jgi:hypothetical protein
MDNHPRQGQTHPPTAELSTIFLDHQDLPLGSTDEQRIRRSHQGHPIPLLSMRQREMQSSATLVHVLGPAALPPPSRVSDLDHVVVVLTAKLCCFRAVLIDIRTPVIDVSTNILNE